ncbi:FAD-binding oxidoreductase [Homoserinimonas sp. OAct 916]|uniref:NAD(P)/FAD-dependent oxidoreductase n=1 Tax=Homoserinimonas sp. OAct 916 TaxID=2211450 RepID=UPI001E3CD20F|nr:FAD-binding oxidoreductase [Homoserinimonas sp. OAct 916]
MSSIRVAVIGSGVAGASTAFALANMGAGVTIIEAGLDGMATAAGAGIVQPWSSSSEGPYYDLYAAGAAYYPTLMGRLRDTGVDDIGYRITGSLVVNADEHRLALVERRVRERALNAAGVGTVSAVTPTEAKRLFPPLASDLGGLHISGGARVDGRALRNGLLKAAESLGATMATGRARLEPVDGRMPRLSVDSRTIMADAIVVAAGAWTNDLLAPLGRRIGLSAQRGQITHLRIEGIETAHWPSVLPMTDHYLVAFDDSRIVAGATREGDSGFDPRVTAGGQREVLKAALAVAPGLANATIIETRVGLRPVAAGALPHLGAIEGIPGLFVNAGFGSGGLTMGPYAGHLLAERVLGVDNHAEVLAPFAPVFDVDRMS